MNMVLMLTMVLDGQPLKTLFGFERVHVKAGETVTVSLYPQLTEFAATGKTGQMELLSGVHTVSFGVAVAATLGMGYATAPVTVHV